MRSPRSRALRLVVPFAGVALALFGAGRVVAGEKQLDPPIQKIEARSFNVMLAVLPGWKAKIVKEPPGVLFEYVDEPARTDRAAIGVFRLVVPAEVRSVDRVQLGRAYVIDDLFGTAVALFKVRIDFLLTASESNAIGGGQLLSYAEEIDAKDGRSRTTKYVRAWVFFPKSYANDGGLYLILGQETFRDTQLKPVQLERVTEIIAGLHAP